VCHSDICRRFAIKKEKHGERLGLLLWPKLMEHGRCWERRDLEKNLVRESAAGPPGQGYAHFEDLAAGRGWEALF
jgi:hypothetical protein